jgi:small-conductance mechanosensitive channel
MEFLRIQLLGNSLLDYVWAILVLVILSSTFHILKGSILKKARKISKKTKNDLDDFLVNLVQSSRSWFLYYVSIYLSFFFLSISNGFQDILDSALLILATLQVLLSFHVLVDYFLKKVNHDNERGIGKFLGTIVKICLWIVAILLVLSNLGINVTSVIAGLGIGGIAIAFALKKILEDLFSAFVIHFDHPFDIGDNIQIGDIYGEVTKIGLKTTRIKAGRGEEVIVPNDQLTSSVLNNLGRITERKEIFDIGIAYETSSKKLDRVPTMIKDIVDGFELARFERAYLKEFGDSALIFEIVFLVLSSDFDDYTNVKHNINLAIKDKFEREKISMAYPTQTVYINKL